MILRVAAVMDTVGFVCALVALGYAITGDDVAGWLRVAVAVASVAALVIWVRVRAQRAGWAR